MATRTHRLDILAAQSTLAGGPSGTSPGALASPSETRIPSSGSATGLGNPTVKAGRLSGTAIVPGDGSSNVADARVDVAGAPGSVPPWPSRLVSGAQLNASEPPTTTHTTTPATTIDWRRAADVM
jgi:hypothetical protein